MSALAELRGVTRTYGEVTALAGIDLDIHDGQVLGLLGPNGAGKTTTLSLVSGLIRPTSGSVRLFGRDPRDAAARQHLGTTPQQTALPETLRVREVIDFVGGHFAERVPTGELAEEFGLADLLKRQTGALSGGQKRRLSVALAFVGRPRLVLLDEPTTGLDIDGRHVLWEAIRRQREAGASIVVTSHYLEEIEQLAERVAVIAGGRVVADDDLATVIGSVGTRWASLQSPEAARIAALPQVAGSRIDGDRVELSLRDADAFVRDLVATGAPFTELQLRSATLEEAFLSIVRGEAA
ncbi:MAG: ABC transporter ATP-binding protein [Microbacteriaceae bacterium]|nr:MAG: ABC transporter ATP-binding protein [Microbacteriaceae bacterium]